MGIRPDELRLAACRSKLGDESNEAVNPGAFWVESRRVGLSFRALAPGAGLGLVFLWSSVIMIDGDKV